MNITLKNSIWPCKQNLFSLVRNTITFLGLILRSLEVFASAFFHFRSMLYIFYFPFWLIPIFSTLDLNLLRNCFACRHASTSWTLKRIAVSMRPLWVFGLLHFTILKGFGGCCYTDFAIQSTSGRSFLALVFSLTVIHFGSLWWPFLSVPLPSKILPALLYLLWKAIA